MNLAALLWGVLSYSISRKMRFVHMDIGNQVSPVLNANDCVKKH